MNLIRTKSRRRITLFSIIPQKNIQLCPTSFFFCSLHTLHYKKKKKKKTSVIFWFLDCLICSPWIDVWSYLSTHTQSQWMLKVSSTAADSFYFFTSLSNCQFSDMLCSSVRKWLHQKKRPIQSLPRSKDRAILW